VQTEPGGGHLSHFRESEPSIESVIIDTAGEELLTLAQKVGLTLKIEREPFDFQG
jgi:CMP-N-acetylneuraminic acid synthetase